MKYFYFILSNLLQKRNTRDKKEKKKDFLDEMKKGIY